MSIDVGRAVFARTSIAFWFLAMSNIMPNIIESIMPNIMDLIMRGIRSGVYIGYICSYWGGGLADHIKAPCLFPAHYCFTPMISASEKNLKSPKIFFSA